MTEIEIERKKESLSYIERIDGRVIDSRGMIHVMRRRYKGHPITVFIHAKPPTMEEMKESVQADELDRRERNYRTPSEQEAHDYEKEARDREYNE